jgi:hypothetical protein
MTLRGPGRELQLASWADGQTVARISPFSSETVVAVRLY